jgi:two-component system response regulator (stage 0 sporulation protein F)
VEDSMSVVLVVDDEQEIVDFLCNFLRRFNISSLKATNGKKAIGIFKKLKPDWVFLDIKMPGMDGIEVLKEMKKIKPDIRVIMITGKKEKDLQEKAKRLGVIDYIVKPLDLEELHIKIKTYILK